MGWSTREYKLTRLGVAGQNWWFFSFINKLCAGTFGPEDGHDDEECLGHGYDHENGVG